MIDGMFLSWQQLRKGLFTFIFSINFFRSKTTVIRHMQHSTL